MLLKKKNGNATENVVALTKEFGRISQGNGTTPFPGGKTFAMNPFVTTKKIYFPGNDPLVIAEHQAYESDGFNNKNYVQTGTQNGTTSFYQNIPFSNNLEPSTIVDNSYWYSCFNNFINWRDCLNSNSSNIESANYYGTVTANMLSYYADNIATASYYQENVKLISAELPVPTNSAGEGYISSAYFPQYNGTPVTSFWRGTDTIPAICPNYGPANKFSIIISGAWFPGPGPEEHTYGVIRNDYAIEKLGGTYNTAMDPSNPYYSVYYSVFSVPSENMSNYFSVRHPNPVIVTADEILVIAGDSNYQKFCLIDSNHAMYHTIGFAARQVFKPLYSMSLTANVSNIKTTESTSTLITGDNLKIHFTSTGNNVTGTIQKAGVGEFITVTANVTYHQIEYYADENDNTYTNTARYDTHDPRNYIWNGSGEVVNVGGGGDYSLAFNVYPIFSNKRTYNPTARANITNYNSGQNFSLDVKTKDADTNDGIFESIPDSYGGAMIFSGTDLTSKFNNNQQDKYIYIGFKGIGKPIDVDFPYVPFSGNFAFKAYKFNDEHFKQIGENTFYFQDDAICKLNTKLTRTDASGSNDRMQSIYGPFFFELTPNATYVRYNTTANNQYGVSSVYTLSAENLLDNIPTILNTINYITPAKSVGNSGDYIITKPSKSLYFSEYYEGLLYNFGNTNKLSYLNLNLPTYFDFNKPLMFNSNITEITQMGICASAFTAMYSTDTLSALTAIKSWGNLINIKMAQRFFSSSGIFQNATALKEVPDLALGRLEIAPYMFAGCISLSSLPDFYNMHRLKNVKCMFAGCTSAQDIPGGLLNVINGPIEDMSYMFSGCTNLTSDVKYIMDEGNTSINDSAIYQGVFAGCTAISGYNTLTSQAAYKPWFGLT